MGWVGLEPTTNALLNALIERDGDEPWAVWWEAELKKENTTSCGNFLPK